MVLLKHVITLLIIFKVFDRPIRPDINQFDVTHITSNLLCIDIYYFNIDS